MQGEDQKKLDVISNEVFSNCLRSRCATRGGGVAGSLQRGAQAKLRSPGCALSGSPCSEHAVLYLDVLCCSHHTNSRHHTHLLCSGRTGVIASEEEDNPVAVEETFSGDYVVVFDPLDGSSNIDAGARLAGALCWGGVGRCVALPGVHQRGRCSVAGLHTAGWRRLQTAARNGVLSAAAPSSGNFTPRCTVLRCALHLQASPWAPSSASTPPLRSAASRTWTTPVRQRGQPAHGPRPALASTGWALGSAVWKLPGRCPPW